MALTKSDIDALERALASGELTVEYGGRRVTYRSIAELKAALDYAQAALAQTSPTSNQYSLAAFNRN